MDTFEVRSFGGLGGEETTMVFVPEQDIDSCSYEEVFSSSCPNQSSGWVTTPGNNVVAHSYEDRNGYADYDIRTIDGSRRSFSDVEEFHDALQHLLPDNYVRFRF